MTYSREIQKILKREPEDWLSYLYGQNVEILPVSKKRGMWSGWCYGVVNFFATMLRNTSINSHRLDAFDLPVDALIFASTENQIDALASTIEALGSRGVRILPIRTKPKSGLKKSATKYHSLKFSFTDSLSAAGLFFLRGAKLYIRLRKRGEPALFSHADSFLMNYVYLIYFYRILSRIRPRFVVTANDHSPENRCLLAVANELNIETVYLQHATVSSIFPPLRVTYAFLDGEFSLKTYRECEANKTCFHSNLQRPTIFLSGQKRRLLMKQEAVRGFVGVAINRLDNTSSSLQLIRKLTESGFQVSFRWHPAQPRDDVEKFRQTLSQNVNVRLSDPAIESVADYLGKLRVLVAGNSSILLEAALAKVIAIFFENGSTEISDYYRYVENGIALKADSSSKLIELVENLDNITLPDEKSVRYYSATFGTEWEGLEGELVAMMLSQLHACSASGGQLKTMKRPEFGPYYLF